MESRKIIKFGNSSFVITLPNEWMKDNKLEKGDEVNLGVSNKTLTISTKEDNEEKRAIIDITNKPLKLFNRELISFYLKNYKFIEIIGDDVLDRIDQIKIFQDKLSSVEIVEINDDKIVFKDLTAPSELNLQNLINEITDMVKMLFAQLIKSDETQKKHAKHFFISQLDSNINKLTFLAFKAINYNLDTISDPIQVKGSIHYWRLVASFETIGDIIKRIARYLRNIDDAQTTSLIPILINVESYFSFITNLLGEEVNLQNNLKLYLDKKQSLLRDIENLRTKAAASANVTLVITQLYKDILGQLDTVILSIIDLKEE